MGHVYSSREVEFCLDTKHSTLELRIIVPPYRTVTVLYALYCTPFHVIDDQSIFFEMTQRVVVILDSASEEKKKRTSFPFNKNL